MKNPQRSLRPQREKNGFHLLFRESVGKIFCILFIVKLLQKCVFLTGTVSTLSRNKQLMDLNEQNRSVIYKLPI